MWTAAPELGSLRESDQVLRDCAQESAGLRPGMWDVTTDGSFCCRCLPVYLLQMCPVKLQGLHFCLRIESCLRNSTSYVHHWRWRGARELCQGQHTSWSPCWDSKPLAPVKQLFATASFWNKIQLPCSSQVQRSPKKQLLHSPLKLPMSKLRS